MGNVIEPTLQVNSDELMRSHGLSFLGVSTIQVADFYNNLVSPFSADGWTDIGYADQISPDKKYDILELESGGPSTSKGGIIIGLSMSLGVSYSHPTLAGLDLSNASNYAMILNDDGVAAKTLAALSTKDLLKFAADTGWFKDDLLVIDMAHGSSYGNADEIAFIRNKNTAGTELNITRLSKDPATGADVKRIAGWGANSTHGDAISFENSGVVMIEGATEFDKKQFRIITYNITTGSSFLTHIREGEVRVPVPLNRGKGKELITAGFTIKVIPQYGNFVDKFGATLTGVPYLCKTALIPKEYNAV